MSSIPRSNYRSDSPKVDFSHAPEMAPYLEEPKAMYVGAPGKHGYLRMRFELDSSGKCVMRDLERRAPLIVQQELYFDEEMPELPCVYILSSGGPNVDGDRYRQDIEMEEGAFAFISTGAATKLAEMRYNYSGLVQNIVLKKKAYLEFMPEPVIPCRHTRFIADTNIVIAEDAALFYSEIYTGGRKYYGEGESFAYDVLSVCTHAQRPDGTPLFREKFIISPDLFSPQTLGVMNGFDVFANVVVAAPKEDADAVYAQIRPGCDAEKGIAVGITHLPNNAGLLYKVLGKETGPVKKQVREFCSVVRQQVKGRKVPPEFVWR